MTTKTLIKYPPQAAERCEYEVFSSKQWEFLNNAETRAKMRPLAGPYFDGEGWMLNSVLADLDGADIVLVAGEARNEHGNERDCITVYRNQGEMLGDFADER